MFDRKKTSEFAGRLEKARVEAGYRSGSEFARSVGMNTSTYKSYERGDAVPGEWNLSRVCSGLQVSPEWLFNGGDETEGPDSAPAGRYKAPEGSGDKAGAAAFREKQEEPEAGKRRTGFHNLMELIDAIDEIAPALPGYLIKGKVLREVLPGDLNIDAAPTYLTILCSNPGVVNYYFDHAHMIELNSNGTISDAEFHDWLAGRREQLRKTPVECPEKPGAADRACEAKPQLKCTSETSAKPETAET